MSHVRKSLRKLMFAKGSLDNYYILNITKKEKVLSKIIIRVWIRRSKIQNLEGGLEGRQAFWTLRPTKKLGTRSKVGN